MGFFCSTRRYRRSDPPRLVDTPPIKSFERSRMLMPLLVRLTDSEVEVIDAMVSQAADGVDNDGDGKIDCVDPDCNGASCGNGCLCVGSARKETTCDDGLDNDCNG